VRKIPAREIVQDIRAGLSVSAIMGKYHLSNRQVTDALQQIAREREYRATRIAADVISGLGADQLVAKYQFSEDGLLSVLRVLLRECYISEDDLKTRETDTSADSVIIDLRRLPRRKPATSVLVQDRSDPRSTYIIRDISEQGLALVGMEAQPNVIRRIAVLGDDFGEVTPFEFEGKCRWSCLDKATKLPAAGFMIAHISPRDLHMLRDFMGRFTYAA
jgi:hypothetical protein